MLHGLLIVADLKEKSESGRRLFRKKRLQLEKKVGLKRLKNGVYFFPIMNPRRPSEDELRAFERVQDLMDEFATTATYFVATRVEPELTISSKNLKAYFILRPIRKSE